MAGKPRQFFLEILEAEADAERLRVLLEEFAGLRYLRGRLRLQECKSGDGPRYPMSIPPFTLRTCPVM